MADLPTAQYLRWKCRRGMLELDVIFSRFIEEKYPSLSEEQQRLFNELLELPDPLLYDWVVRRHEVDPLYLPVILEMS